MARRKSRKSTIKKSSHRSSKSKNNKPLLETISPQRRRDIFAILLILVPLGPFHVFLVLGYWGHSLKLPVLFDVFFVLGFEEMEPGE